jgi:uncharacterized protein (TIGR01777 family)
MKIVITGGSGFIGTHLCQMLHRQGDEVIVIGPHLPHYRQQGVLYVTSDLSEKEIPSLVADCEGIIHLAGANVFHRWTKSYKKTLLDSRVNTALAIYHFLSQKKVKPRFFISASAVGFYGDRGDNLLDESASHGKDFLASVCVEWERAREKFASLGMRTISIRTGTVISAKGGALAKMLPPFRWGLGGKLGSGLQWFSWIHMEDLLRVYIQAISDERMIGPINAVAPGLIRNRELTQALGSILKKPTIFPIPSFLLRAIFGECASLLTASQRVVPHVLHDLGFQFAFPTIQEALRHELLYHSQKINA